MDIYNVPGLTKPKITERVEKFGDLDFETRELIEAAIAVRKKAYAPYSNFKVGAAFRSLSGKIYKGCNVESASFTPTSCAERSALAMAVSDGCREFLAGAVVAYQDNSLTTPCGVCRQFIVEFASEDIPLFITRANNNDLPKKDDECVLCTSAYNLLPHGFRNYKEQ